MAEQAVHNVVNGTQSTGLSEPVDVTESTTNEQVPGGGRNDVSSHDNLTADTDTSVSQSNGLERPADDIVAPSSPKVNGINPEDQVQATALSNESGSEQSPVIEYRTTALDDSAQDGPYIDVEWRRRNSTDPTRPLMPRERSNSMKKPAFKAVSVTKNFLAKTVGGTAASPKSNIAATGQSPSDPNLSARPRLVAKSGRDARTLGLANSGAAGGPDASKVWNRNRPLPPAPPKQFTDEELKQQYGIHLATRLQADEPGKGAKWADMEDDEDDWAPDTVEWMDGTKSSLQPSENEKGHMLDALPSVAEHEGEESGQPSSETTQPPTSTLGPGKTILRPGARATAAQVRPGLVLKSVPENPPPPPKPATPATSRSPWASLPPVDKVSPISFNLPQRKEQPRPESLSGESDALPNGRPMQSPAREIAADTFDRSWRDSDRGSRELFDSRSGRYEPVKTPRRTSMRQEGSFRPPAVLQRPSQSGEGVERSAANGPRTFGSQDARVWDRRGSSIAEDRARPEHRNSIDQSVTSNDARSDMRHSPVSTKTTSSDQHPSAIPTIHSPVEVSNNQRAYSAHGPPNGAGAALGSETTTDVAAMQQQIMREKLQANRRRKEEEQAREEAAKQERIKQRLLALGDLPKKVDPLPPVTSEKQPVEPSAPAEEKTKASSLPAQPAPTNKAFQQPQQTQPPNEEITTHLDGLGDIPPDAMRKAPSGLAIGLAPSARHANHPQPTLELKPESHPQPAQPSPLMSQTGSEPLRKSPSDPLEITSGSLSQSRTASESQRFAPTERQNQQWNRGPAGFPATQGWTAGAPGSHAQSGASVWGPPSQDKSLGNGAFDSDVARVPSINFPGHHSQSLQHSSPSPGPIAPPSASPRLNGPSSRTDHTLSNSSRPPPEWMPQESSVHQHSGRVPFGRDASRPLHRPMLGQGTARTQGVGGNYLNGFRQAELAALEQERINPRVEADVPFQPIYHETIRRTLPSEVLGGEQKVVSVHKETIGGRPPATIERIERLQEMPPPLGHYAQFQQPNGPYRSQAVQSNGRTSSRFFSGPSDLGLHAFGVAAVRPNTAPRTIVESQTGHLDDDLFMDEVGHRSSHPLVNLPKPRPKVKLPAPRALSLPSSSQPVSPELVSPHTTAVPQRQQPPRFGQQPIVQNAEWQNRFDFVTGRKANQVVPSSGPHAAQVATYTSQTPLPLVVTSSATAPLEVDGLQTPATVSLPQVKAIVADPSTYSLPPRDARSIPDDGYLWDEPEAGSRPTVLLPKILPSLLWGSTSSSRKTDPRQTGPKPSQVSPESCVEMRAENGFKITIHLLGHPSQVKNMIRRTGKSAPRQNKASQRNKKKNLLENKANPIASNAPQEQGTDETASKDQSKPIATARRPKKPKQSGPAQLTDSAKPVANKPTIESASDQPTTEKRSTYAKNNRGKKSPNAGKRTET